MMNRAARCRGPMHTTFHQEPVVLIMNAIAMNADVAQRLSYAARILAGALVCVAVSPARGLSGTTEVQGLTEPYRTIEVAAAEVGIVTQVNVREGDVVSKGQVLATLDKHVLCSMLALAKQEMQVRGPLEAALAELRLSEQRAKNFATVFASGHARAEEVQRAQANVAIARARVHSAEEELALKKLEYEKIEAQLERRRVIAPRAGIVSEVYKDEGEFVVATNPSVLQLVQLDPLLAVFSLTPAHVQHLRKGQNVQLRITGCQDPVAATVEFIAPIANAESGTLLVKIRCKNPGLQYRSGMRCTLELSTP